MKTTTKETGKTMDKQTHEMNIEARKENSMASSSIPTNADLSVGAIVLNFGFRCEVIGHHAITGDPILRECGKRRKWLASADKCSIVGEVR